MASTLEHEKNEASVDNPNDVYVKACEATMSEEETAKMAEESEAQVKELLNKK